MNHNKNDTYFIYIGLVSLLWVIYFLAVVYGPKQLFQKGQFGDSFGALNTLFSGLAFAILIFTANLQRQELKLQREEMISSRKELEGQKEQLRIQNDLSIIAAKVNVIPILIDQKKVAINQIGGIFSGFSEKSFSIEEYQKIYSDQENQLTRIRKTVLGLSGSLINEVANQAASMGKDINRLERALPKIKEIIELHSELEISYNELINRGKARKKNDEEAPPAPARPVV